MAGFYIRQDYLPSGAKITELSATFFVGGSANIWIFSFSTSLYVRLGMVDGNMTGEAVFTFSFSLGFTDFEFVIRWVKEEKKGFEGEEAQTSLERQTRYASLKPGGSGQSNGPTITRDVKCQSENWRTYSSYFDQKLSQKERIDGIF